EWRDNIWIVIELILVSFAIWALSLFSYSLLRPKFLEKGFEIDNVYRLEIRSLEKNNPEYVKDIDNWEDLRTLMARIRKSPYVEVAGFSSNALPYNFNYSGNQLNFIGKPDSIVYQGNLRMGSPEMARVLKLKSVDNTPLSKLEASLRKGNLLISNAPSYHFNGVKDVKEFIGEQVMFFDTVNSKRIGGVIESVRRNEYENTIGTIFMPIDEQDGYFLSYADAIAIRVKPDMGKKFEEEFYSSPDMKRMRNIYLTELTDMKKVRAANQNNSDTQVRLFSAGIGFLLIIVFLGLLGTFWFRIRQRTGEIALRKTCGATSANIFRRVISEGLILLVVASPPALLLDALYFRYYMNGHLDTFEMSYWESPLIAFGIATILMAMMIIIGIIFPARRAMRIEPAIALKEE
ncbi:MAG: FtsX-like permease family protein, partial [Muribaculaceae bacterium]|nr:FtsX-like permease family protein [Muribaculaceae bacterium]